MSSHKEPTEGSGYHRFGDLTFDHQRSARRGLPEVIYGAGKSEDQLCLLLDKLLPQGHIPLITRLEASLATRLQHKYPSIVYYSRARMLGPRDMPIPVLSRPMAVLSAGASDEPVAEEAALSAIYLGARVERFYDVGVACLARILDLAPQFDRFSVLIVVAGMEGALPSVVAGLTKTPVLAVPTSVGYGANLGGIAALLGMINSCAGGVSVFNIDSGFGAAYQAVLIGRKIEGL